MLTAVVVICVKVEDVHNIVDSRWAGVAVSCAPKCVCFFTDDGHGAPVEPNYGGVWKGNFLVNGSIYM